MEGRENRPTLVERRTSSATPRRELAMRRRWLNMVGLWGRHGRNQSLGLRSRHRGAHKQRGTNSRAMSGVLRSQSSRIDSKLCRPHRCPVLCDTSWDERPGHDWPHWVPNYCRLELCRHVGRLSRLRQQAAGGARADWDEPIVLAEARRWLCIDWCTVPGY